MWSRTYRELMKSYYFVEIGRHSYGASLWPGELPDGTRIGNYCSLAAGIVIFRRNHPTDRFSQHPFFFNAETGVIEDDTIEAVRDHPLVIEHDVWIGANAIITPRCARIEHGAIVAAGAIVTKNVPPFTIVAGVPARAIGQRFSPEIQAILLETRWWELPIDKLVPFMDRFIERATIESAIELRDNLKRSSAAEQSRPEP